MNVFVSSRSSRDPEVELKVLKVLKVPKVLRMLKVLKVLKVLDPRRVSDSGSFSCPLPLVQNSGLWTLDLQPRALDSGS